MKTVDHSNHTMKRFGFTLLLTLLLSMLGNNAWAATVQKLNLYEGGILETFLTFEKKTTENASISFPPVI